MDEFERGQRVIADTESLRIGKSFNALASAPAFLLPIDREESCSRQGPFVSFSSAHALLISNSVCCGSLKSRLIPSEVPAHSFSPSETHSSAVSPGWSSGSFISSMTMGPDAFAFLAWARRSRRLFTARTSPRAASSKSLRIASFKSRSDFAVVAGPILDELGQYFHERGVPGAVGSPRPRGFAQTPFLKRVALGGLP